jgi:hypothetical protein
MHARDILVRGKRSTTSAEKASNDLGAKVKRPY